MEELNGLVQTGLEEQSVPQTGEASCRGECFHKMQARIGELQQGWDSKGHKSVAQESMSAGDIGLF